MGTRAFETTLPAEVVEMGRLNGWTVVFPEPAKIEMPIYANAFTGKYLCVVHGETVPDGKEGEVSNPVFIQKMTLEGTKVFVDWNRDGVEMRINHPYDYKFFTV